MINKHEYSEGERLLFYYFLFDSLNMVSLSQANTSARNDFLIKLVNSKTQTVFFDWMFLTHPQQT